MVELNRKTKSCLSAVILSSVIQADGFLCLTGPVVGGRGAYGNAVASMSTQVSSSSSSSSLSPAARSPPRRSAAAATTTTAGSFSRCRPADADVFKLNLSPYEEYMATRKRKERGQGVEPEENQKASLFERYMKSREKQATLSPAEKDKSLFEEYTQTRPTPAAAPVEQELSPYEEYMASRKKVEAAAAATTAEEKAKASLFSRYLASRGLTAEDEAKAPKEERAANFAKYLAARIKARAKGGVGRWLAPLFRILPGGKTRAEKKEQEEKAEDAAFEDALEASGEDPDSAPLNGAEIDVDAASRANWRVDVEYTEAEKIAMFDDYMASREKVKAAMTSAQVTPEEVETVSEYDAYRASRAQKEAALKGMAPEEKTRSLFDDYMASRRDLSAKTTGSSAAVELTKSTFDSAVLADPTKHALVYFYAPWCVHCQNLDEDFQKLAKTFEKESGVVVAKVNAIDEKDLKMRFGVKKYPTLQYFYAGQVEVYTGARDLDSMVHFLDHMNKAGVQQHSPPTTPPPPLQKQRTKKPGEKHIGTGGMADTRDPAPINHADPRKSISAAPSFEEYLKSKRN
eukprot:g13093.t1